MQTISLLNLSTVLSDQAVSTATRDLQTQVKRDFASAWAVEADLQFCPRKGDPPKPGSWWLVVLDDADQASAVGYHDLTVEGLPLGKIFARTDTESGHNWTVTASHELLEMLADPWMDRCCLNIGMDSCQILACEVCDPCEDDGYGYVIGNTLVSDFILPTWFDAKSPGSRFDFCGHMKGPLQILAGGYIGSYDFKTGWTQLRTPNASKQFESGMILPRQDSIPFGARRERRVRKDMGAPLLRSGEPIELPSAPDWMATARAITLNGRP
ncbi:hypothetical protein HU230_0038670 [Bradyrhizobium quebecense]|uniref:Uncharacterized protein n=1 Tax=Bradyrhizobium quebecense TaxID=2748629 RepID=A0A973WWK4_9BRAD|nr:hypothetical protein [Bradyrhizobium quebecense]UGA44079.1 hypothetical protein HU230_0038670 [Bradyrhizobium quebecense]